MKSDFDGRWSEVGGEVIAQIKQWRLSHPKASLNEIEQADVVHLDQQMAERPCCPQCDEELVGRGQEVRELETAQHQRLRLERSYATCPRCGVGLFPLDEELGLLPGKLTPRLQQAVVRLGA